MREDGVIPFEQALAEWRLLLASGRTTKDDPQRYASYDSFSKARRRVGFTNLCRMCGALPGEQGFVRFNWPVGHALFGRPVECPLCTPGRPGRRTVRE